jgi:single-strand DNA-binding protein
MALGEMTLTAIGRLTAPPELRFTAQGVAVAEFTIAVNPREMRDGKWTDLPPSFVPVKCWKQLAENVTETLTKGVPVIVTGRWREERWEQDGQTRARWVLTAEAVGPNLSLCTARLTPTASRRRSTSPEADPYATTNTNTGGADR